MGRLLIWVLLGMIVYALMRGRMRIGSRRAGGRPPHGAKVSEPMVRCQACGLNVPQSEALAREGRWFCSREHLERAPSRG